MDKPASILSKYWGYSSFRTNQEAIINSVLEGNDTMALLPTGGGKSICFQIPGLLMQGMTLVITPLIALMKDQVEQLRNRNIVASAIYSGLASREIDIILDNCALGKIKFLYLSPERLETDLFQKRLSKMDVSLLAIDEAHCISQWGYDFRPSYLKISSVYDLIPNASKIALTATATDKVREDILEKLQFSNSNIFRNSFLRKNLSYSAFNVENKEHKILEVLKGVPGSSIIYVRNRKETLRISNFLGLNGINSIHYHGGMAIRERNWRQKGWIEGKFRTIVATNAFGMGIDKSDVRSVVHYDIPDSPESYYQEAGRAGRDGKKSFAVLLFSKADLNKQIENFQRSFPEREYIQRVYKALANYYKLAVGSSQWHSFNFEIDKFVRSYDLKPYDAFQAIKQLEHLGVILLNESFFNLSTVTITISHEEIYKFCVANVKQEPTIKALLRLYGGELYTEFVRVKESDIARLIKIPVTEVIKNLEFLSKSGVLVFDKSKEKPQITFLTPRLDTRNIFPKNSPYLHYKSIQQEKLKHIQEYAQNSHQCRTRYFQEYFGEETYLNCGTCDHCLRKKKDAGNLERSDEILEEILKNLDEKWIKLDVLKEKFSFLDEFVFTECIRMLIDQKLIELNKQFEVRLKDKK